MVTLLYNEERLGAIGDTRNIAEKRFYSLERRLGRDPALKAQYAAFIQEYLDLGHIKEVKDVRESNSNLPICYLPHHCILKPTNETNKE